MRLTDYEVVADAVAVGVPIPRRSDSYASLPFPTLLPGFPAYVSFEAPIRLDPTGPVPIGGPFGWRIHEAEGGQLVAYLAPGYVGPVAPDVVLGRIPPFRVLLSTNPNEAHEARRNLRKVIGRLTSAFFSNSAIDAADRVEMIGLMKRGVGQEELVAWATAAPDFFEWAGLVEHGDEAAGRH